MNKTLQELKRALAINKIVNSHCHTEEEGNGITTYRGHMGDRYTMYELIDITEVSGKKINDDGYNITVYSDKLMAIITYCEGDFIVEACKTKEVYKARKEYTIKWYKENY